MNEDKLLLMTQDSIAKNQLDKLPADQQRQVFQLINEFYQKLLEGDTTSTSSARVVYKHNPETNQVSFRLECSLEKASALLNEARNVSSVLAERYLSTSPDESD